MYEFGITNPPSAALKSLRWCRRAFFRKDDDDAEDASSSTMAMAETIMDVLIMVRYYLFCSLLVFVCLFVFKP